MLKRVSLAVIYFSCMAIAYFGVKMLAHQFGGKFIIAAAPIAAMMFLIYLLVKRHLEGRRSES